ncbi:MAG: NAD-binding protein [Lachnospiraceae bacterium]|nr:NAD-binding protein [Lachnospiraceae bacterium]
MKNVTCYGSGVIGTAWAVVFLKAGKNVTLFDISDEVLEKTKTNLTNALNFFKAENLITEEQVKDCLSRATFTTDVKTAVENAEFIQESAPERLDIKKEVAATIEEYAPADAIICSSTSGLLISDIARDTKHKERFVGGHPYNPVYLVPLVEITKGEFASDENVAKAKAFYTEVGKEPIVLNREVPGFVCNRIQIAVMREAYDLVDTGVVSVEDVDKAVAYSVGLRYGIIGPHLVNELGGGPGGIRSILTHIGPATKAWLEDMAKWTVIPEGYIEKAVAGVADEMANREPGRGQSHDELQTYLNRGMIQILKYQGKL